MQRESVKPSEFNKPKLYNPVAFFNAHFGKKVTVHLRRDEQSGDIPLKIEGELVGYDTRSGLLMLNTKDKHVILDNRGSRAYFEIERA